MRAILGVLSLVIALAIVGVLAKKQMASVTGSAPIAPSSAGVGVPVTRPNASPLEQSQQMQQQVKQSVEATMQQARPMPDDK